jgi:hypothetical protein
MVRILSAGLSEPVGPSVDDGIPIDVLDAAMIALLEFLL